MKLEPGAILLLGSHIVLSFFFFFKTKRKADIVVDACVSPEAKIGGSEMQGNPWLSRSWRAAWTTSDPTIIKHKQRR